MRPRAIFTIVLFSTFLSGLAGCGAFADPVTDCDTSAEQPTCQCDERFPMAGTSIVVHEFETITEAGDNSEDQTRVEARITLDGDPAGDVQAQLHIVESLTDDELFIDPDRALMAGEQVITWDFASKGFARRIQLDIHAGRVPRLQRWRPQGSSGCDSHRTRHGGLIVSPHRASGSEPAGPRVINEGRPRMIRESRSGPGVSRRPPWA